MNFNARSVSRAFLSLAIIATLASISVAATPDSYNAVSDLLVRPKPPLPQLGLANDWIVDPTFGTRILRVTDPQSYTSGPNNSFWVPSAGFTNNWGLDSRHFWISGAGGSVLLYSFDPTNFAASPTADPAHPDQTLVVQMREPWFSLQNPNLIYGIRGQSITRYDLSTNTYTPLFDLGQIAPFGPDDYAGLLTVDATDTFYSVSFIGIQQTYPYCVVWNRSTGQYTLLDVQKNRIQSYGSSTWQPANLPFSMGIHQSLVDRTGRYVDITRGSVYSGSPAQDVIWDTQTGQVKGETVAWSGHNALGYGDNVNASGSLTIGQDGLAFSWRSLDLASGLDNPVQVTPTLPVPYTWEGGSHPSWANAQPGQHVPFFTAIVRSDDSTTPLRPWQFEIIGIATDGSQKVWRFCHYRSSFPLGAGFDNADPRGTVSPDGHFYMFESNWENTLGPDAAGGQPRSDVFIVELEQKYAVLPPPGNSEAPENVQLFSPTPSSTVSGTVMLSGTAQAAASVSGAWYILDFQNFLTAKIPPPFTFNWDTTNVSNGEHILQMAIVDERYNTAETPYIVINVDNPPSTQ